MDELSARLVCHQLCLPNNRLARALEHFGASAALLTADSDTLARFFREKDIAKLLRWEKAVSLESNPFLASKRLLEESGIAFLALTDEAYPPLLKEIPDPPALLYVQGNVANLKMPQIAIVGSRKMTPLGGSLARQFALALGCAGLGLTSGLALGIDSCAHMGALDSGAATVAVLGTGIDRRYPRANTGMYDQILNSGGTLVSEYLLGTPPRGANFPKRNRIITGLSMATLVVEAAERSGTLVSARLAAEQGREVFVIPGSLNSPMSVGCHSLIREGATLVTSPAQIIEDIGAMLDVVLEYDQEGLPGREGAEADNEHWLLLALGQECLSMEEICDRCDQSTQEVAAAIARFELSGTLSASPCGYQRVT